MKNVKTTLLAASLLLFAAGSVQAVEMDDLGVTIKMINSDDMRGASSELHLPDVASDVAREHAEGRDGKGLSRANEAHNSSASGQDGNGNEHAGTDGSADKKDEHDAPMSGRDESRDSHEMVKDSHEEMVDGQNEIHDENRDVQEQEDVRDGLTDGAATGGDTMGDTPSPMITN